MVGYWGQELKAVGPVFRDHEAADEYCRKRKPFVRV
jgi:hypothetical protein